MRFNVNRELFSRELSVAQDVVEKKATIAILSNILLQVNEEQVYITATDLDLTYQSHIPAVIDQEGSITVLAGKMNDIFRLIPTNDVLVFLTENGRLRVEGDSVHYELPTQSPDDYPKLPDVGDFGGITVDQHVLQRAFEKVLPSIAQDEYKYQYGAILAKAHEDKLELVSIDGYRLNRVILPARMDPGITFPDILITRKAALEITKMEDEKDVRLVQHEKFIAFIYPYRKITCRQPQVQYTDYSAFLEDTTDKSFRFNREEMMEAIRRVSVVSSTHHRGVKFLLDEGKLVLDGSHPDYGEAMETISVEFSGEPIQIMFNIKFVQDFLSTISCEKVTVKFTDQETKTFFLPEGEDDIEHTHILMPITL